MLLRMAVRKSRLRPVPSVGDLAPHIQVPRSTTIMTNLDRPSSRKVEATSGPVRDVLERVLRETNSVAIVGLGANPERPIFAVAEYLQEQGLTLVPIHPSAGRVLGERALRHLDEVPADRTPDTLMLAVRPEVGREVVAAAIRKGRIRRLWLQPGAEDEAIEAQARAAGFDVVSGHCMMHEYKGRLERMA